MRDGDKRQKKKMPARKKLEHESSLNPRRRAHLFARRMRCV
jgi:hypothetical protein